MIPQKNQKNEGKIHILYASISHIQCTRYVLTPCCCSTLFDMRVIEETFQSRYCQSVFTITFILTLLLIPRHLLQGWLLPLTLMYIASFSITVSCFVRETKERVIRAAGHSITSIIGAVLGYTALHACSSGAFCSGSVGLGIISALLPKVALSFITQHAYVVLALSIAMQFFSLWQMRCFQQLTTWRPNPTQQSNTIQLTKPQKK